MCGHGCLTEAMDTGGSLSEGDQQHLTTNKMVSSSRLTKWRVIKMQAMLKWGLTSALRFILRRANARLNLTVRKVPAIEELRVEVEQRVDDHGAEL